MGTYTRTYTWKTTSSDWTQMRPYYSHESAANWGNCNITGRTAWIGGGGGSWNSYLTISGDTTHQPYRITSVTCKAYFHHSNDSGSNVRFFLVGNSGNTKWSDGGSEWVKSDKYYETGESSLSTGKVLDGNFLTGFYGIAIYCSAPNMYVRINSSHAITVTFTFVDAYPLNYYNGSTWVQCEPYYYNGSQWVRVKASYYNGGWKDPKITF